MISSVASGAVETPRDPLGSLNPDLPMDHLSQSQYLELAEQALRAVESAADAADIDSRREGSVLTLELDNAAQVIINLQPPVQELWLASKSGAFHFRCRDGRWLDTREGRSFAELLQQAIREQGGPPLQLAGLAG